jgi:hypothetical protein
MRKNIAIIVLGCASPPYDVMIQTIRNTWASMKVSGIDIYFLYGNPDDDYARIVLSCYVLENVFPVKKGQITAIDDMLLAGCADRIAQQKDCILRKRLIAFDYLAGLGTYDFIYTVCASSYVDQRKLMEHTELLTSKRMISGAIILTPHGVPFVSGASMLMSADIAEQLGRDKKNIIEQNRFDYKDDVAIGHWIVTRMSGLSLEAFANDIREHKPMAPEHIFISNPRTTVDYVMKPMEKHRPVDSAFHYHFHSRKPGDMVGFHQKYFSEDR